MLLPHKSRLSNAHLASRTILHCRQVSRMPWQFHLRKCCTCRLHCGRIRGQRGHVPIISIRGCNTDELERAADELEKATSELVKRAEELAKRSEELNRQLLRLAEALTRPTMIKPREVTHEAPKPANPPATGQPSPSGGILDEVKEFLDQP